MGVALWPYKNRTLEKMSGARVSRLYKAGSTGLRSERLGEPHRCPKSLSGVMSVQRSRTQRSHCTQDTDGGSKKVRQFRTECRSAVDRVPGIYRGIPPSLC